MATIKTTDENFDQVVLKSEKPFVQRFTAEWCGPCKMIAPLLEELSDELKDKVLFGSHNIDDLRVKYDELKDEKTLGMLNDLSEYIEEIQTKYESA